MSFLRKFDKVKDLAKEAKDKVVELAHDVKDKASSVVTKSKKHDNFEQLSEERSSVRPK